MLVCNWCQVGQGCQAGQGCTSIMWGYWQAWVGSPGCETDKCPGENLSAEATNVCYSPGTTLNPKIILLLTVEITVLLLPPFLFDTKPQVDCPATGAITLCAASQASGGLSSCWCHHSTPASWSEVARVLGHSGGSTSPGM